MTSKRFIAIAGNIGSGKTTLTTLLANRYQWQPHFEVVTDNPYLEDFYADISRWSFQLQIFFLSKRFQAHQEILRSNKSAIQDRSVYEDAYIFARSLHEQGKMLTRDYENYLELFKIMEPYLEPPDLLVYVKRSIPQLLERIRERGRDYEKKIPETYLKHLNDCYEEWIAKYQLGKVLTVHADELDFKNNPKDLQYVCESIENTLEQPHLFVTC